MKKILIATTALVATASVAAADVSFGGYGRFGLTYDDGRADETVIEQRFRLTITGTTESDAGVKFEGRVRIESNEAADNSLPAATLGAAGFAVTSGGFRLDVGHVSDVLDSGDVLKYFRDYGLTGSVGQQNAHALPLTGFGAGAADTTTIKLKYSVGDFTGAASYSNDKAEAGQPNDIENWQLGAGYVFGDYSVGAAIGKQTNGAVDNEYWALGAHGAVGDINFGILVTDADTYADVAVGLYADYAVSSATTLYFSASDGGPAANTDTAFGFGVKQDLGGGVSIRGAIAQMTDGDTYGDLGVVFNF